MRRSRCPLTFVVLTATLLLHAGDVSAAQSKCVVGKTKCVAKKAAALLKCEQKAETPGKPADPNDGDCVTKADAKFDGASDPTKGCFEKLENKAPNDCVTFDNTVGAGAAVDACVASLVTAIDPPPLDQSACGVGKKKCVGKLLKGLLACQQKAQTPGKPTDPNAGECVTKAKAKFTGGADPAKGCFSKLESAADNDCSAPLGNTAALEALVDACMNDLVAVVETPPVCTPGAVSSCYTGPPGTVGVGPCAAGMQTCEADGLGWSACVGQVLPTAEVCGDGIDQDCDGSVNGPDLDGDGWPTCLGDCCDVASGACTTPASVNPGAFEVLGNGVDDDCDAATSDVTAPAACSTVQKFASVTGVDFARGMDVCQTTTSSPPLASKKWGLISATAQKVTGATPSAGELFEIQNSQSAVLVNYGTSGNNAPRKNGTMAGLSTGIMRDATDSGYVPPAFGTAFATTRDVSFATATGPIATYLAAHGGGLVPGTCGALTCPIGGSAHDGVLIRLQIRVPTNAQSFSYDLRFFSAEYETYQCTSFNDYFLALLTSGAPGLPADRNITADAVGRAVNVNTPFLDVCNGNSKMCDTCPYGTADLAGTGMDAAEGGGTPWLTTSAPVVPGETITLEFLLFDVGDAMFDSLVLLDNFRWSTATSPVTTHD